MSIECSHKFSGARKLTTREYTSEEIKNAKIIRREPIGLLTGTYMMTWQIIWR